MSTIEVYIEQPPVRRLVDTLSRSLAYFFTMLLALLPLFDDRVDPLFFQVPFGVQLAVSGLLGTASLVGLASVLLRRRMIELSASAFVVLGLVPYCIAAVLGPFPLISTALLALVCVLTARNNALRTAVLRAETMKDMNLTNDAH